MNLPGLPTLTQLAESGREPRVHGNGFVQLDLNDEGTQRLRVWDDDVPRQATYTGVHDHVFSMRSRVLVGTLIHTEYDYYPAIPGSHEVYRARREKGTQNTTLVPEGLSVVLETKQKLVLGAGSIYTFPAHKLHESTPRGLTATLMEKFQAPVDYGSPMVLVMNGYQPDNEFQRDGFDPEFLWSIIARAVT